MRSNEPKSAFHVSCLIPLRGIRGIHCNSSKTTCLFSSPSRYGIFMYHQCEEPINNYCAHVMREFTNQKCWNLSTNNEANHCYTRGTLWPLDMQHHRSPRIVWTYPIIQYIVSGIWSAWKTKITIQCMSRKVQPTHKRLGHLELRSSF